MLNLLLARRGTVLLATVCVCLVANPASASVHVTYDVLQEFETEGFTASWLHSATSGLHPKGSPENGALMYGAISSRISGSLAGDLSGNVLSNVSGSVTGSLKQLSVYLNDVFGTSLAMGDSFELRLGGQSSGGGGALAFETDGAGSGQFTGGFLDFSLYVAGVGTSLLDGTFFFKPQAESGNAALSPNRGTSSEFTLWGWNWMHDGEPIDGTLTPDWDGFLAGLGYTGPSEVLRTPPSGPALQSTLGVALYVVDSDRPSPLGAHAPEPTAAVVWGLLMMLGAVGYRHRG